jgi:hypothetical protein
MGLMALTQKNVLLENHGVGQDPHRIVVSIKKKNRKLLVVSQ